MARTYIQTCALEALMCGKALRKALCANIARFASRDEAEFAITLRVVGSTARSLTSWRSSIRRCELLDPAAGPSWSWAKKHSIAPWQDDWRDLRKETVKNGSLNTCKSFDDSLLILAPSAALSLNPNFPARNQVLLFQSLFFVRLASRVLLPAIVTYLSSSTEECKLRQYRGDWAELPRSKQINCSRCSFCYPSLVSQMYK